MRLWGMVTDSAERDDGKPKNIMKLNQSLMGLDYFEEKRDSLVANRKSLSLSAMPMIRGFENSLGCFADINC
jgi:hypothetical protein